MTQTYEAHMEKYLRVQSEILNSETEFVDEEDITSAIKITIPTSKYILKKENLELYRKTKVSEKVIQAYLESLRRFKERITLLLSEPLK